MIICPVCKKDLIRNEKTYRCENNHSFDMGKQGYLNLLLSNQKHSKTPGDDKEMVLSRKRFLEKDYYKIISDRVNSLILENLGDKKSVNILDIGCGEGYYTGNIKKFLEKYPNFETVELYIPENVNGSYDNVGGFTVDYKEDILDGFYIVKLKKNK